MAERAGGVRVDLADDELHMLVLGLTDWGVKEAATERLAAAMGFASIEDLLEEGSRIAEVLAGHLLEARHRAHARVEDRIRIAKDTGLGRFPSREFTINQAWLIATMVAADLTAWTRLLAFTGDAIVLAGCEPKALRYRLLHVPARLTHTARKRRLQIPDTWPWAAAIVAVFANIAAIPPPA